MIIAHPFGHQSESVLDYILYHTLGCHLCELAEEVISDFNRTADDRVVYVKTDIASDDDLVQRFGIRIPVLYRINDQRCLDWPFNTVSLQSFVHGGY
ncbi:glutaredoxin family protein [Reinekea sp. G2M2-21]|uniref:glutaredoxin family protein n=1 Tax=Reinekea sp. G2M2-21 TaxID=2788942 RepID=UPI001E3EA106|nr:glutaredoxin family protein [Reinekea sp. G2M2-21]